MRGVRQSMMKLIAGAVLGAMFSTSAQSQDGPGPNDLLASFFYTVAVVDYCKIKPDPVVGRKLARAAYGLQVALGLSHSDVFRVYEDVKLRLVSSPPDCTSGSADIADIQDFVGASK